MALSIRGRSLRDALATYQSRRRYRVLSRAAMARAACAMRRPGPVNAPLIGTPLCQAFGASSALALRWLATPIKQP
jgi:hypothetical protein